MNHAFKRVLSFAIALVMILSLVPAGVITAFAAGTLDIGVSGLTADYTDASKGTSAWSAADGVITGSVKGKQTNNATYAIYAEETTTLTLTNTLGSEARLTFDFALTHNYETATTKYFNISIAVNGSTATTYTASDSYAVDVPANGEVVITLNAVNMRIKNADAIANGNGGTLTISNVNFYIDTPIQTTFAVAENGSYTVDGETITADTVKEKTASGTYALVATPDEGYSFAGWYNVTTGTYISSELQATVNLLEAYTVKPLFIPTADGVYAVGDARFTELDVACACAASGSVKTVVILKDVTLTKNYTIPAGVTLLVPYSADQTVPFCAVPEVVDNKYTAPTVFRTLTLAENVTLTVNGALSVDSKHASANSGSAWANGAPTGTYGHVSLKSGSSIVVNGALYAWGFINGAGTVTAKSGAVVYENMQVTDFRGGNATLACVSAGVFPFSQYYVQNIESALKLEAGAEEYIYTSIYMGESVSAEVKFIGASDAMFVIEEGYVVKKYDGQADRLVVDVYGDMSLSGISLDMSEYMDKMIINSADFILPITNNITINVNSGVTTLTQDLMLLPGCLVTIDEGALISAETDLYLVDASEYVGKNFVRTPGGYGDFVAVTYAPSKSYTRTSADLADAKIVANGVLSTLAGLYTTSSGASIVSTGNGIVSFDGGAGTNKKLAMYNQSNVLIPVSSLTVTNAQLLNADGTYVDTTEVVEGDLYMYDDGQWCYEFFITYDPNGGAGNAYVYEESVPALFVYWGEGLNDMTVADNTFTKDGANFIDWNTAADGSGDRYDAGDLLTVTGNVTLYAQWEQAAPTSVEITWVNGTTELGTEEYDIGAVPSYKGTTPTKAADGCTVYTFAGWQDASGTKYPTGTALPAAEAEATYFAYYTETESHTDGDPVTENEKAATCGADGSYETVVYCSVCGDEQSRVTTTVPALGHTEGEAVTENEVAADCENDGSYDTVVYCTVCDAEVSRVTTTIPALGHDYVESAADWYVIGEDHYYGTVSVCANDDTHVVYNPVTGLTRVPYPTEEINGVTYGPNAEDASGEGYTDAETGLFIFDENGVFQSNTNGLYNDTNWAVNGQLPWHVGLVEVDGEYYYFVGENVMATGNVYVYRNTTDLEVNTNGGVYTFGEDGKLGKYDGITEIDNTLYYYESYELMLGNGLTKVGENYIYVRSNGALVVSAEYWVPSNNLGIVPGTYSFDENGFMISPKPTAKDGVYFENGAWYYYENGVIGYNKGLIEVTENWVNGDVVVTYTGVIYVRSNGTLAIGRYWTTNTNGMRTEGFYDFDENGVMKAAKNGIVAENGTLYYYVNNVIAYNAGVIQLNGNYYYVRSNGEVVNNRSYWITNVGDSGVVAKNYYFDENGVMQNPVTSVLNGIVNGYYYVDGAVAYGAGVVEVEEGVYIYVRSNGQLATGEYWITNTNGLLAQGKYDFGTDGLLHK